MAEKPEEARVSRRRFLSGLAGAAAAGLAIGAAGGYALAPPKIVEKPVEKRIKAG